MAAIGGCDRDVRIGYDELSGADRGAPRTHDPC
jgi:hypothetical protein